MRLTTLCYLEKDGKYLMLHRDRNESDPNYGKWIGVGGHVEDGETGEECVRREVLEETGLTLGRVDYRGVVEFHSDVCEDEQMHLFTSDDFSGEIKPCDEGELRWVEIDKVPELPIWEGDGLFLELLRKKGRPFFTLSLKYRGDALVGAALDGRAMKTDPEAVLAVGRGKAKRIIGLALTLLYVAGLALCIARQTGAGIALFSVGMIGGAGYLAYYRKKAEAAQWTDADREKKPN